MIRAMKKMVNDVENNNISAEDISEEKFSSYLDTKGIPDPDLMIRTSGEMRISNFMLWQNAYAEMYFPKVAFPAFTEEEFDKAIVEYTKRDRRFGGINYEDKAN
mgnify:CR=1 FL=1